MSKFKKILSVISGLLALFLSFIFIQQKLFTNQSGDSWQDLGFFLIMFVFLIMAIILTIVYLIIGFKSKFKDMKVYSITQLSFLSLSIIFFLVSIS